MHLICVNVRVAGLRNSILTALSSMFFISLTEMFVLNFGTVLLTNAILPSLGFSSAQQTPFAFSGPLSGSISLVRLSSSIYSIERSSCYLLLREHTLPGPLAPWSSQCKGQQAYSGPPTEIAIYTKNIVVLPNYVLTYVPDP